MPKRLLSLFFLSLLPGAALAECGFAQGEQGLTIIVGKSNRCFDSGGFRNAFRETLVSSVQAMDAGTATADGRKRSIDERSARGAKLWNIAEGRRQASLANAAYYGQR
ncbi:hypothetical protein [Noviherbaspirillum aridicola]|uniref:Uncharacterized protein n=1 Tax=Noviherbaspirillum aridicola TaxID=2849687 RepID=A0ABQ4Q447_9BURK|nr:hypothetical protein [Noviherbaspirillum aridicola]GIZ51772.1 hypothetical protein NCCP691_17860 [Noviherbaspirillum aridicola]